MNRWYVVQVYTGFEDVVKRDLECRVKEEGLEDDIKEVVVPASKIAGFSADDEDDDKKEKIFPGYVLVNMEMTGETFRLVSSTARVSRFLGGESPVPLSDAEVERIFSQMSGELAISGAKESFSIGNEVFISGGPFSGFIGIIDKVDEDKERLTVMVSIFGRLTPVELGFDQVKR
jgi:transcription termination/antitermination protein NusG